LKHIFLSISLKILKNWNLKWSKISVLIYYLLDKFWNKSLKDKVLSLKFENKGLEIWIIFLILKFKWNNWNDESNFTFLLFLCLIMLTNLKI